MCILPLRNFFDGAFLALWASGNELAMRFFSFNKSNTKFMNTNFFRRWNFKARIFRFKCWYSFRCFRFELRMLRFEYRMFFFQLRKGCRFIPIFLYYLPDEPLLLTYIVHAVNEVFEALKGLVQAHLLLLKPVWIKASNV